MCSPRKSNENFSIFTFYESKQMSLTQDLRWSLGRSIALQLQRQTDLLLCTVNCFLQWDHLPNMAVGDLAFYYTLYLWRNPGLHIKSCRLSLFTFWRFWPRLMVQDHMVLDHNNLKEFSKSNVLQDHIWNAHCSRSMFAIYFWGSMLYYGPGAYLT